MHSKVNSLEEKVKLPPTETISRCYQPQQSNRKVIRILTVAVYVLCVSLAAIMLSLYYIFIWDPTIRPFVTKGNHCDKIVIPEKIAIRLLNSSEVTAEQFYKHILEQYRKHNQMQQQRQQFLQKLDATNRFQEIFATATIIQAHPREPLKKPLTPTNGTFRLEPQPPPPQPQLLSEAQPQPHILPSDGNGVDIVETMHVPILLDTSPPAAVSNFSHLKRKSHRGGHYKHHRGAAAAAARSHQKKLASTPAPTATMLPHSYMDAPLPLNPAAGTIVHQPQLYTSMPIPLILSSSGDESESKRPSHHAHAHGDRRGNAQARRRATTATVSGYDAQTYLNPFLTGELIFEK